MKPCNHSGNPGLALSRLHHPDKEVLQPPPNASALPGLFIACLLMKVLKAYAKQHISLFTVSAADILTENTMGGSVMFYLFLYFLVITQHIPLYCKPRAVYSIFSTQVR